jgi:long-chain acyl-CoA synthetase
MLRIESASIVGAARHAPVLVHADVSLTGAAVDRQAEELAAALASAGVQRSCRVAMVVGNSPLFVIGLLAAWKLRASAVLCNPQFTERELADATRRARIVAWLAPPEAADRWGRPPDRIVHTTPAGRLALWRTPFASPSADPDEAIVQFTSGVSGRAKIVPRSIANLAEELDAFARRLNLVSTDGTLCPAPLFHAYGLINGLLLPLFTGRPAIVVDWFLPGVIADLCRKYCPAVLVGVPTMYHALAETYGLGALDLRSVRICFSAGAPISETAYRRFETRFGKGIHQQYGSTETGVVAVNLMDEPSSEPLAVGAPIPGRDISVVDEAGRLVEDGRAGEIVVRSPATAAQYIDDVALTAEKFRAAGYFTGDIGLRDGAGQLTLCGRRASFINVAGLKVDPSEVEGVLTTCDAVVECAVVPCRDALAGETVTAVVVARREISAKELQKFCRRHLAAYKVPRQFRFIEALPRSATGKVLTKYLLEN